jgi:hypothetical protein
MDGLSLDQIPYFLGKGRHVRRSGVSFQCLKALPLFDHNKRVGAKRRLSVRHIDGGAILDATCLGMHGWHNCPKRIEDHVTQAWFGCYKREDMNHILSPLK